MQSTALSPIEGKGGLLYNVVDEAEGASLACDAVRADVFMPGGVHHVMKSSLAIDGGKVRSAAPPYPLVPYLASPRLALPCPVVPCPARCHADHVCAAYAVCFGCGVYWYRTSATLAGRCGRRSLR